MSQNVDTTHGTDHRPGPVHPGPGTGTGTLPVVGHPGPRTGDVPVPREPRTGPIGPIPPAGPTGYGHVSGWSPEDLDTDDPRPEGNPAAASSCVFALLAVLVGLRPLAFGSMVLTWDTYAALALAAVALLLGVLGLRGPVRRAVAVVGVALSLAAMLVIAVLPAL